MRRAPRLLKKDRAYQENFLCMPGHFFLIPLPPSPVFPTPVFQTQKTRSEGSLQQSDNECYKNLRQTIFHSQPNDFSIS